jgi:DNA-binding protein Fis
VPSEEETFAPGYVPTLLELEQWGIRRAMKATKNNKTRAAEILGISRQTLRMKLKEAETERSDTDPAGLQH